MLEPRDLEYFNECISEQAALMTDVTIHRCLVQAREGTDEYPDNPIKATRKKLYVRAEVSGVTASEIERSGGTILAGDLKIWTVIPLKGPDQVVGAPPGSAADIVTVFGRHDYVVTGMPDLTTFSDGVTAGYSTTMRRRAVANGGTSQI